MKPIDNIMKIDGLVNAAAMCEFTARGRGDVTRQFPNRGNYQQILANEA